MPWVVAWAILLLTLPGAAAAQTPAPQAPPTQVEEVVVTGVRTQTQVETFVDTITAPPPGRGPARWEARSGVCVGAVNFRSDIAQALIDRVSAVAIEVGLRVGEPGCASNITIIGTSDAPALAAALVAQSPNAFRPDYAGSAGSRAALDRFVSSNRPVRWWHVAMPMDAETGTVAVRLPGEEQAPYVRGDGLLRTNVRNDLRRAHIIVDIEGAAGVSLPQLADYIALVALVQITPEPGPFGVPTILDLFDVTDPPGGLTDWDRSYLAALYDADLRQRNPASQAGEIADRMLGKVQAGTEAPPE